MSYAVITIGSGLGGGAGEESQDRSRLKQNKFPFLTLQVILCLCDNILPPIKLNARYTI